MSVLIFYCLSCLNNLSHPRLKSLSLYGPPLRYFVPESGSECQFCKAGSITDTLQLPGASSCSPCDGLHEYDDDENSKTGCKNISKSAYKLSNVEVAECEKATSHFACNASSFRKGCGSGLEGTCEACTQCGQGEYVTT